MMIAFDPSSKSYHTVDYISGKSIISICGKKINRKKSQQIFCKQVSCFICKECYNQEIEIFGEPYQTHKNWQAELLKQNLHLEKTLFSNDSYLRQAISKIDGFRSKNKAKVKI